MKIYNVLVEYTNFEDEDNNYSEIIGSFSTKEKAIIKIRNLIDEETQNDMQLNFIDGVCNIIKLLDKFGYLSFLQECGYGETRIILSENELDKESV